jgi:RNA polymerase sigma factor (sigma-70 family)
MATVGFSNEEIDRLIKENLGLVKSIVKKYKPKTRHEYQEMVQCGRIGMWKALLKYDKDKGALTTFCYNPIHWEILAYLKKKKIEFKRSCMRHSESELAYVCDHMIEHKIWEYIPELSKDEMDLITSIVEGNNYRELSEMYNITMQQVRNRVRKLFDKVRCVN